MNGLSKKETVVWILIIVGWTSFWVYVLGVFLSH